MHTMVSDHNVTTPLVVNRKDKLKFSICLKYTLKVNQVQELGEYVNINEKGWPYVYNCSGC